MCSLPRTSDKEQSSLLSHKISADLVDWLATETCVDTVVEEWKDRGRTYQSWRPIWVPDVDHDMLLSRQGRACCYSWSVGIHVRTHKHVVYLMPRLSTPQAEQAFSLLFSSSPSSRHVLCNNGITQMTHLTGSPSSRPSSPPAYFHPETVMSAVKLAFASLTKKMIEMRAWSHVPVACA